MNIQPIQWLLAGDQETPLEVQPNFIFDGHEFPRLQPMPTSFFFYLAYKARRGDEAAALILKTFTIGLNDVFGKPYWPVRVPILECVGVDPGAGDDKTVTLDLSALEQAAIAEIKSEGGILLP